MKRYLPEGKLFETTENQLILNSPLAIEEAMQKGKILEAKAIICDNAHNLIVDLGCMQGVIPRVEGALGIKDGTVRDIAMISRVGKPVCFIINHITRDDNGKSVAYLSRAKAQQRCFDEYTSRLSLGDVIDAYVTHLEPFGAFCDIGCGLPALLPIDAISVSRISHPRDRFSTGDLVKVVVKTNDSGRITLSQKELLGTWEENAMNFSQGETVSGIVRSVESYGIFVELSPNLAGLAEIRDGVTPGQQASVYIKSIIPEKMKIKLIIIDSFAGTSQKSDFSYFITDPHIDKWRYSPTSSSKLIESVFA